tara:strand:- start:540 stop:713 length:174 start_codon:yes stop_codon:yes gene_type:complete
MTTTENNKKKFGVCIKFLNKFDIEATSEEEAVRIVNNMDNQDLLNDSYFNIEYIYES